LVFTSGIGYILVESLLLKKQGRAMKWFRILPAAAIVALSVTACSDPTAFSSGGNIYGVLHFGSGVGALTPATVNVDHGGTVYSTTAVVSAGSSGTQQASFHLDGVPPGACTMTFLFTCNLNSLTFSYLEVGETGTPTLVATPVLNIDGIYDWTCTLSGVSFPENLTIDFYAL
jgi:hypothetical protein